MILGGFVTIETTRDSARSRIHAVIRVRAKQRERTPLSFGSSAERCVEMSSVKLFHLIWTLFDRCKLLSIVLYRIVLRDDTSLSSLFRQIMGL